MVCDVNLTTTTKVGGIRRREGRSLNPKNQARGLRWPEAASRLSDEAS